MGDLLQDLRYGLRMLAKNPGFTAVAVLTLALGIGANTAIFSLIDAVLLKMLPVRDPEQLVLLNWTSQKWPSDAMLQSMSGSWDTDKAGRTTGTSFPFTAFQEFLARNQVFSNVFGFAGLELVSVNVGGEASTAEGAMVSGDFFAGLGVLPAFGRMITPTDDQLRASPVAVISYGYWQRRFGADRSVVGKGITLNRVPFTIVGVTPPEFFGIEPGHAPEIWVPLHTQPRVAPEWSEPGVSLFTASGNWWLLIMGRLKAGVGEQQARAQLDVLYKDAILAGVKPAPSTQQIPDVGLASASRGLESLRQEFSRPLFILMAVVGLVLMIACGNVAGLQLARASTRQREVAVRLALGAGRVRLIRQLLTESVLLALMGGACGVLFAAWGTDVLVSLISSGPHPITLEVRPDFTVLAFTAIVSCVTGIVFGLAPAFRTTRVDLTPALKASPSGALTGQPSGRVTLARSLVVSQVGISLLLLVGAGLFVRTLLNCERENLGFNRDNLLLFTVYPSQSGYTTPARLTSLYTELLGRIQALPGVRSASMSQNALIGGGASIVGILVKGYQLEPGEEFAAVWQNVVGPNFLDTMGIKLLLGRDIGSQDTASSPKVAVVNKAMARHFFGGSSPVGRSFRFGTPDHPGDEYQIVGLADDAKYRDVRQDPPPTVYLSCFQRPPDAMRFEVRVAGDSTALRPAVRHVVQELDKDLPIFDVKTQVEQIDETLMQERLFAKLSGFFGGLALLLACLGLYGLLAYSVLRRTGEIGIRMALGARRGEILGMVMQESLLLVLAGVAIGILAALAATRIIASQLYELKPYDPATFAAASVLLSCVAVLASYIPARRATKVDPMVALRYE